MNVKELKEIIKYIPDDLEVWVNGCQCVEGNVIIAEEATVSDIAIKPDPDRPYSDYVDEDGFFSDMVRHKGLYIR